MFGELRLRSLLYPLQLLLIFQVLLLLIVISRGSSMELDLVELAFLPDLAFKCEFLLSLEQPIDYGVQLLFLPLEVVVTIQDVLSQLLHVLLFGELEVVQVGWHVDDGAVRRLDELFLKSLQSYLSYASHSRDSPGWDIAERFIVLDSCD